MDKAKAIELLRNAVPAKALPDDEIGFFIEAVSMAIKALKKAETNCPEIPDSWIPVTKKDAEDVPAIPLDWITKYMRSLKSGTFADPAWIIKTMLEEWKEEQEHDLMD